MQGIEYVRTEEHYGVECDVWDMYVGVYVDDDDEDNMCGSASGDILQPLVEEEAKDVEGYVDIELGDWKSNSETGNKCFCYLYLKKGSPEPPSLYY